MTSEIPSPFGTRRRVTMVFEYTASNGTEAACRETEKRLARAFDGMAQAMAVFVLPTDADPTILLQWGKE